MERYGFFRKFANGSRVLVGAADDLNEAKAKILDAARRTGKERVVYDLKIELIVAANLEKPGSAGGAAA